MRRAFLLAAIIIGLLVAGGAALAPMIVPTDRATATLMRDIAALSGFDLQAKAGAGTLRLLPRPSLSVEGIEARTVGEVPGLSARRITARLRLWPLLRGVHSVEAIDIEGLTLHADSVAARDMLADARRRFQAAMRAAPPSARPTRFSLSDATIVAGTVARSLVFTDIAGQFDRRGDGDAVGLRASGRLRGQAFTVAVTGPTPASRDSGERSPVQVAFEMPLFRFTGRGVTGSGDEGAIEGNLTLEAKDLGEFGAWLDLSPPLAGLVGKVAIAGSGRFGLAGIDLTQADVTLDDSKLEGTLAVRFGEGVPVVTGTLAAATLDLGRPMRLALQSMRAWRQPVPVRRLAEYNVDLRLSASRVVADAVRLDDVALSAVLRRGRLEVTLGRAVAGSGLVRGRLAAATSEKGLDLKINGTLAAADLAAMSAGASAPFGLNGLAQGTFAFDASGETPEALVKSLLGSAEVTLERGEFSGVDLPALARRWLDNGAIEAPAPRGRTPIAAGRLSASIWNGVAEIKAFDVAGAGYKGGVLGRISLPTAQVDLTGFLAAEPLPARRDAPTFRLVGPWRQPTLSSAAPPLRQ